MRIAHQIFGTIAAAFRSGSGKGHRPAAARHSARLTLESLDLRLPPSSLLDTGSPDPTVVVTRSNGNPAMLARGGRNGAAPVPPQVTNFVGAEIVGGLYRFSGDVIDAAPGGLTVTLGGEPDSLQGVTVLTDANGHFERVLPVKTDGSDNGTADAQTINAAGIASNIALCIIHPG